jgi:aminopeptidase N
MKRLLLLVTLFGTFSPDTDGQVSASDSVQYVVLDTVNVSVPAGASPYRATTPTKWDIIDTRIALTFNRKEKTAAVREWIKIHPYCYATDSLTLDAKGVSMDSVMLSTGRKTQPLHFTYKEDELRISFDKTYKASDTIVLYLKYTSMPYGIVAGGSSAISEDRGLYFINTDNRTPGKASHIWTQGETESNSHWMITIDKPNSRFTTQIELTVPDSLTTLSNGALIKQVKQDGNTRTDIWKMDKPIQAYAAMFAIGRYSVIKDKWRGKEVSYYVEPAYAPYARQMFAHTTEMLEFFSKKTGVAYPWNKYSQVVVRDYVSGAMENTTASLFGEFMYQNPREIADRNKEDIVAHELFHQWFGDYVSCESWSNLTLSESFANYGEQLWSNWKYGKAASDELAWNDLQGYIASSRTHDPQLVRFYYDDREEMFDGISYNKGGAILHYLHTLAGDAVFENAMQIYLTKNALGAAEAQDWRLAVEQASGLDWNWFFNEWYYHAGHPVLKVNYNYGKTALDVTVEQVQEDTTYVYQLPLKTAILTGGEEKIVDWNINKRLQTFRYPYVDGLRPVIIPDRYHLLPGEIKENKKSEHWLTQYQQASDYVSRRLAVQAAGKQLNDSVSQIILDLALNDTIATIRRLALQQMDRTASDKLRNRWTVAVTAAATKDKYRHVRAEAFDVLGDWKVIAAKPAMIVATFDSSYAVAGNALEALEKLDKDTAYVLAKLLVKTQAAGALEGAIWTLIGKKGAGEDVTLYREQAPKVYGAKKMALAASLNNYLKNVAAEETYKAATDIYADMIIYETANRFRSRLFGFACQVLADEQAELKDDNKEIVAKARTRSALLKATLQRVINEEPDAALRQEFEKKMNEQISKD